MATERGLDDEKTFLPQAYMELRKMAKVLMARLPAGCTLQPTALVHNAWIRLEESESNDWQSRVHFIATMRRAMRQVLVDDFRRHRAARHGGGLERIDISTVTLPLSIEDPALYLEVYDAVERFVAEHPDLELLVELVFFEGLTLPEAACLADMTRTTAYRRWDFVRTKLCCDLRSTGNN